jgi:hypothetical protein
MAANWVCKKQHTHSRALELWETKVGNCEVILQALAPLAKYRMEGDRPKAPSAVHRPLGTTCHQNEKANAIADR